MFEDDVEELRDKLDVIIDHVAVKSVVENRAMRTTESLLKTILPRIGHVSSKYHKLKREVRDMVAGMKHVWVTIHRLEDEIDNSSATDYNNELEHRIEKLERKVAKLSKQLTVKVNLSR